MLSECGIEMSGYLASTPLITVGQQYVIPGTPYVIRHVSMDCDQASLNDYNSKIELIKHNVVIETFYVHPPDTGHSLDGGRLCLAHQVFDCQNMTVSFKAWWNIAMKELVTNLDLPAWAIDQVGGAELKFVRRYTEGSNNVYVYSQIMEVKEFGAGALFGRLLSGPGLALVATFILASAGVAIVWMWRDAITKTKEYEYKMGQELTKQIEIIIKDPNLTPQQKTDLINELLKKERERIAAEAKGTTDWGTLLMWGAIGVGALIVLSSISKR